MNTSHANNYCYLDQIRITDGADQCRSTLSALCRKDTRRAVTLLNDRRLMFPSLYILRQPIMQQRMQRHLNQRNMAALNIANEIKSAAPLAADPRPSHLGLQQPVLKWILETGYAEDISEDDYEEILDVSASVLINTYRDSDILPLVVELLFKRNRTGGHIHDLVWALFRFHSPQTLKLIALRLRSSDTKDAALAAELLNLEKTDVAPSDNAGENRYEGYLRWLEENEPYLYFTEESFQYTSRPTFCTVDLERKYLQKSLSAHDKEPLPTLENEEGKCLAAFNARSGEEQRLLSNHSHRLWSKSESAWKEWLYAPIDEQIKATKAGTEGEK